MFTCYSCEKALDLIVKTELLPNHWTIKKEFEGTFRECCSPMAMANTLCTKVNYRYSGCNLWVLKNLINFL